MAIILNEHKYAQEVLEKNIVGNKPSETLSVLARYYKHKENRKDKDIYNLLDTHMKNFYPNYNPVKWSITIDKQVKKAKRYPLIEIDYIPITKSELDIIGQLKNIRMKRIAFTVLACAKFSNLRNENNNNWVNREYKELFKLAYVNTSVAKQCNILHELEDIGLVSFSKKVDNTNIRVEFIDNTSDIKMKVEDMRELGLTYMEYLGANIINCERCGRLIAPRGTKRKYCAACSKYQPIITKTVGCIDCKKEIIVEARNNSTNRCDECYEKYRRECIRQNVQKHRKKACNQRHLK